MMAAQISAMSFTPHSGWTLEQLHGSGAIALTFLAWVIGWIDVGNRERALHVHLNRRARGGVRIVMHVCHCNAISPRRQG